MRRYLVAAVACGVVISGCAIGTAVLLAHIAAAVITEPAARSLSAWAPLLVVLAGLWTVRTLTRWLQARLGQRGASAVIAELAAQVLGAVTARSPRRVAVERDEAITIVTHGLDGLRPYLTGYLPALLLAAVLTPATVVVIACSDGQSALLVALTLPLIPVFMVLIGVATADRSAAALSTLTTLRARLLDLVAGIPTLRALGRASEPEDRIAELSNAHRHSTMATLRVAFLSALVLELLAALCVALIAVSIGLRLVFGELSLTTGLTVLLLAPDVYWPLRRIGVEFHAAQDGKTAAARAFALIDEPSDLPAGGQREPEDAAVIRLQDLTVASRGRAAPHRVAATLRPGEITVLTGANGAGKSTTLQVLAALTAPTGGRVWVGDTELSELDLASWWRRLAWLPQRPVLVPGTVATNLSLFGALPDIDGACAASGFDRVLHDLPEGLQTWIGRGGVGLSLGQRQRLGLARALGSPAGLLLLDEPTAHLDAATEERALVAIADRARAGATVVIAAHRDPVLAIGDQIIEVTEGAHVAP
ncbi:thiol reductant ABC exporter subunit CydD [Mycobacterium koreense]|uniref:Thiol reductant ABC exporter subunit CydD n=1 Tax=Mycolicibacillus koreensis TaxID=1069220 RepID=A0A7I7S9V7_9MYCO|nr:thiol reductant ABC exporter subunit CydD [Mycolicibacillus koreensis]MCV7248830.1 thiol reductant ABC exporter subunit CydD [Mycolicibacillus koreensis]ODR08298.1 thiol reductant ABC exporter subunit CydD [Mycolicibacillus koreensis]OSC36056.1 thiol reductant ABC exporter subunit CydD [Mycolicibacillus koreensis]BBY53674.1 thiol reductant ABC exporter subunit CydD [Mycolicibacillus koreensis]